MLPRTRLSPIVRACSVWLCVTLGALSLASGQGLLSRVLGEIQGEKSAEPPSALPTPAPVTTISAADVETAIAALQAEESAANQPANDPRAVTRRAALEIWRRIQLELPQVASIQSQVNDLSDKLSATQLRLEQARQQGPPEKPPYSFLLLDRLIDQQFAKRQQQIAHETELELAREKRDRASQRFDTQQRRLRLAQEAYSQAKPQESARLYDEQQRATLEEQLAAIQFDVAQRELSLRQLLAKVVDAEHEYLGFCIEQMKSEVVFSASELQQLQQAAAEKMQETQQSLQQVQSQVVATEDRLQAARQDEQGGPLQEEYVRTYQAMLRVRQSHEQILLDECDRLGLQKELWTRRYQIINQEAVVEEIHRWREESKTAQKHFDTERRVTTARLDNVRAELAALDAKDLGRTAAEPLLSYHRRQMAELRQLARIYERELDSIRTHRWSHTKLLADLQTVSAISAAAALVDSSWQTVGYVWNFELIQVEGTPITVKKIVIGCTLVVLGYAMARMVSWLIGRALLPRVGIHGNARRPLQAIVFYVLFITCTLFALRIVCVPLTAFTVVGGALAIGVGVGSQSIANNFISGLILLAERPVREGDTVEVEGAFGTVEKIGTRSTRIRTLRNHQIVVPNSKLLEHTLINWTLNDDRIRTSVSVGIAYGSPTTRAAELMLQATREVEQILQKPEPQVYFTDFGENALLFEVHYWITLSARLDRRLIDSRLRFAIERLFRQEQIVIAYPQRDIHLNTASPIQVQVSATDFQTGFDQRHAA